MTKEGFNLWDDVKFQQTSLPTVPVQTTPAPRKDCEIPNEEASAVPENKTPASTRTPAMVISAVLGLILGIGLTLICIFLLRSPTTETDPAQEAFIQKCQQAVLEFQQREAYMSTTNIHYYSNATMDSDYHSFYKHGENWLVQQSGSAYFGYLKYSDTIYKSAPHMSSVSWLPVSLPDEMPEDSLLPWLATFPWADYAFSLESESTQEDRILLRASRVTYSAEDEFPDHMMITFGFDDSDQLETAEAVIITPPNSQEDTTVCAMYMTLHPMDEDEIAELLASNYRRAARYSYDNLQ